MGQWVNGTVQQGFQPLFFSLFESARATDQWVKIFSILVKILRSSSNFRYKKTDSRGYDTPGSHVLADFLLTRRGIITQGD